GGGRGEGEPASPASRAMPQRHDPAHHLRARLEVLVGSQDLAQLDKRLRSARDRDRRDQPATDGRRSGGADRPGPSARRAGRLVWQRLRAPPGPPRMALPPAKGPRAPPGPPDTPLGKPASQHPPPAPITS